MDDIFKEMLRLQKEFQEKWGFKGIEGWRIACAMAFEACELASDSGAKWWKKKVSTREERLEELIDLWHFMMHWMIENNVTPEEFFEMYKKKLAENYRRQENGY
jgi:dimeric dUTPase (all-alpha-NTP-PPase superfamily)